MLNHEELKKKYSTRTASNNNNSSNSLISIKDYRKAPHSREKYHIHNIGAKTNRETISKSISPNLIALRVPAITFQNLIPLPRIGRSPIPQLLRQLTIPIMASP